MNIVIIHGNLGADPKPAQTKSGLAVCNMSVATNERKQTDGEWVDHTEWHQVTVFGKQAENCSKHLTKGSKVVVNGKLRTRKYTDKTDVERRSTEIVADRVEFSGKSNNAPATTTDSIPPFNGTSSYGNDEIPF